MKSRGAAKRSLRGTDVVKKLEEKGIIVKAGSMGSVAEEAPEAYKDVSEVVNITHEAGISRKIVKAKPMGVVKG